MPLFDNLSYVYNFSYEMVLGKGSDPMASRQVMEVVFRPSDEFASQAEDPVCDWIIVAGKGSPPGFPILL